MSNIYDIDFSSPHDEFMKAFQNHLDDWGNEDMKCSSTEQGTKNGKYMYKIEVTSPNTNNTTTMLFEKNANNGDIICIPSGFSSFGGTFYKHEYNDSAILETQDDTMWASLDFLADQAKNKKGKFVAQTPKATLCIVGGNSKQAKNCIVDSNGNVYGSKEVKTASILGDSVVTQFNQPIGEWIKAKKVEDPRFAVMVNDTSKTMQDKMNFVGKYLIAARNNDEIDSEEFKDIFHQAGLIGFTEPSVLQIYKLIV